MRHAGRLDVHGRFCAASTQHAGAPCGPLRGARNAVAPPPFPRAAPHLLVALHVVARAPRHHAATLVAFIALHAGRRARDHNPAAGAHRRRAHRRVAACASARPICVLLGLAAAVGRPTSGLLGLNAVQHALDAHADAVVLGGQAARLREECGQTWPRG